MDHCELAKQNFLSGYSCAQAVLLAFSDLTGLDEKTALLISSSFGGGMGRMRETCGAFCGVIMVAGLLYGYTEPRDFEKKSELYKRVQELAAAFRELNGSIICREMLGAAGADKNPTPEKRTADYYKKRPCPEICKNAAKVLDDYIEKNPMKK